MRMVFSISASRISCSGSAAARCGSTGPSRSKSTHSKGMGGLRKGLFSPFITIPSHLLRAFQRKASPAALGAALRANLRANLRIAGFLGLGMAVLTACEAPREPGVIAPVEGFAGFVAGDEPRAVTIGRDVIGNGGSAADAAVAMYFAMAVTLPSRVGLAGGGI